MSFKKHFIASNSTVKDALELLSKVGHETILFSVNDNGQLIGSITDGDVRRGLLKGLSIDDSISTILNENTKFIKKENYSIEEIKKLKKNNFEVVPVLDNNNVIVNIVNFRKVTSYLPIDVVIMAGGLGTRLKPLTDNTPKPLLKIGNKTIIDHNIDRLIKFGVDDFWISVRYLADQIKEHLGNGNNKKVKIQYIEEDIPLGTIGAVSKIKDFNHDNILVTNSDILTNLNYEDFFEDFIKKNADMSVVTIPYEIEIPYAVMETKNNKVLSFIEKPTYTYYSNGGIYLIKKSILDNIPKNKFFNSTDLMESILEKNLNLVSYPMHNYWLDIGKHEDYNKALNDVNNLTFL
tara:strand:+ start:4372 stop:5418 length:1047 start_codon:yes stop_codon:yes gene_type:complete